MNQKVNLAVSEFLRAFRYKYPTVSVMLEYDSNEDCFYMFHKSLDIDTKDADIVGDLLNTHILDKGYFNVCFSYSPIFYDEIAKKRGSVLFDGVVISSNNSAVYSLSEDGSDNIVFAA